jgi:hypothetical protein
MNAIKFVLIAGFLVLLTWAFRNRRRVGLRAGTRIGAVLLTAVAITSILDPGLAQSLANHLGVTRGTDLLLYVLIMTYILTSAGGYFRSRDLERRLAEVVRAEAIRDAIISQGIPGADRQPRGSTTPPRHD